MKKVFLSMFAAATMLFGTSCSEDQLVSDNAGDEAVVSFTLNLSDGIQTKAISDGTTVDDLVYCVYDKDGNKIDALSETKKGAFADDALTTTVNFTLVKGQTYSFSFWAQDENAPYTHDDDGKTVTVNYEEATANDENRDAFYAVVKDYTVTNSFEQNVTLTRPFAQLNYLVTSDELTAASNAGFVPYQSSITLKNVATTLNMFDATVSGSEEVTFDLAAIPAKTELTKVKKLNEEEWVVFDQATGAVTYTDDKTKATDFRYLATTYLLVNAPGTAANDGKVKSTLESTSLTVEEEGGSEPLSLSIPNVPVQWNYRTNIFGSLLTANGKFYIEIDPAYEEDSDYTVNVWDGATEQQPKEVDGAYVVSTAAEWIWLANNSGWNNPISKDIKLNTNIDFGGKEVKPITVKNFDGQGFSVRNAVLVDCANNNIVGASLFGSYLRNATIKNLNIYSVTADVNDAERGYAGAVVAEVQDGCSLTLDNVHVYDSNIKGMQGVGGLVGNVVAATSKLTVKDCSVNNTKVWNYAVANESGFVCGLVGKVLGTLTFEGDNKTNDVTVVGIYAAKRGEASIDAVAAKRDASATITGSADGSGVTVTKYEIKEGVTYVGTAEEFEMLADKTLDNDMTVQILADIDMQDATFKLTQVNKTLTINGNGYTISNLKLASSANSNGGAAGVSLFYPRYSTSILTINDLNISDVVAHNESTEGTGHNAAVIASYTEGNIVLNKVHVFNADVKAMEGVGVLVGLVTAGTSVSITDCSVNDSKVSNLQVKDESGFVAAMVGKVAAATVNFTGSNSINNTVIDAYYAENRGEASIDWVAVKRVETAVITGVSDVQIEGGNLNKKPLDSEE